MILVNGARGIGTGYSTFIPSCDPKKIADGLIQWLKGKSIEDVELVPWYQGFKRSITTSESDFIVKGNWRVEKDILTISELPIETWTSDYKEFVDKLLEERITKKEKCKIPLISSTDNNTDTKVYFDLEFESGYLDDTIQNFETLFHLKKKISLTNMHLYNNKGAIQKYNTIFI